MSYLPRPATDRTRQDVEEIYALATDELQQAVSSPEALRQTLRRAILRAYEAGTDAQREIIQQYQHERPTPVPPLPTPLPPPEDDIEVVVEESPTGKRSHELPPVLAPERDES